MTADPAIDLASEMGFAATDYALVAVVILVALAFLTRRIWRRKGTGSVCDSCPGCGSGEACALPAFDAPPPETKATKTKR